MTTSDANVRRCHQNYEKQYETKGWPNEKGDILQIEFIITISKHRQFICWLLLHWSLVLGVHRFTLRWRHNGCDSVSNYQPHHCLLNRLFRRRSKKTSKHRVTGLCAGNSPGTGEFSAQMASNAENVSIWWRHHDVVDSQRSDRLFPQPMIPELTQCL